MRRLLRTASALNPFGPIFTKELRVTSRRKRSYVLRVIYLGLLLLTLLATFAGTHAAVGGIAARAQQQAIMGCVFFFCFSLFCVVAMGLIAPVLTATAINSEQLHKTLHVLLMTPIGNMQIVSGKLFSRLLVALMLIGLSLPVLALVRLLGGVELGQMLGVVCICASFALGSAALGLFFSTLLRRAYAVILISYGAMLFLYLFVPMFFSIACQPGPRWIWAFCAGNPVVCTVFLAFPERVLPVMVQWWPTVLVQLVFTTLLVLSSALMLRRIARKEGGGAQSAAVSSPPRSAPPHPSPVQGPIASPPPVPAPPAGATHNTEKMREVSDNPILWREIRRPLMRKLWQKVVAGVVVVGLLGISYLSLASNHSLGDADTQDAYAIFFCGIIWLLTCILSATAIAQEKESDTWTVLLATPLTGAAVVWGKVLGLLRRLMWPMLLIPIHFSLFALGGVIRWAAVLLIVWVIVSFNAIWIATGLYLSLRLKKVTTAVIVNLLLAVFAYGVVFLIVLTIAGFSRTGSDLATHVGWAIPYMYLAIGMEGIRHDSDYSGRFWGPGNVQLNGWEFLTIVLVAGSLYLLLTWSILGYTSRRFDQIVGRAGQRRPLGDQPQALESEAGR